TECARATGTSYSAGCDTSSFDDDDDTGCTLHWSHRPAAAHCDDRCLSVSVPTWYSRPHPPYCRCAGAAWTRGSRVHLPPRPGDAGRAHSRSPHSRRAQLQAGGAGAVLPEAAPARPTALLEAGAGTTAAAFRRDPRASL